MKRIGKMAIRFSTKKENFFWKDVNPSLVEAEYAVRGIVPTLATTIKNKISSGDKSNCFFMQATPSNKSPSAILAILNNSNKNPSPSSDKCWPASPTPISSRTKVLTQMHANELKR